MNGLQVISKNKSLTDQAYEIIKNAIITNKLTPGEMLAEEKLARQLNISRTPVKVALTRLVYEMLATVNENNNIVVADLTRQQIEDITVVRKNMEVLAIGLLKERMTLKRLNILENLCLRYDEAIERGDIEEMLACDYEFHVTLAAFTDNHFLLETISTANRTIRRYLMLSGTFTKHSQAANVEHQQIVECLKAGDFVRSQTEMSRHLEQVETRILQNE